MEESVKNLWLAKIKSGKVAVIESHYAPKNNTNCIWLKDGQMYVYGNSGWESLGGEGGTGGFITTPVNFNEIKMSTIAPLAYTESEADGILFNPVEIMQGIDVTLKYLLDPGPDNPKNTRSLDDIATQTFHISAGELLPYSADVYEMLAPLGFSENVIGVAQYTSRNDYGDSGFVITTVVDNGKSYVVITDPKNNVGLVSYYDNPAFKGITIEKAEEEPEPEPGEQLG